MKIEWTKELELGIPEVDKQHKWLVDLINRINDSLQRNSAQNIISTYVNSLIHYTNFHFGAEETMLENAGFSNLNDHKAEHVKFVDMVTKRKEEYDNGDTESIIKLLTFLNSWLTKHILVEDKSYVPEVKNSLAKAS